MNYKVIGWTNINDSRFVDFESTHNPEELFKIKTTIIKELRKNGYKFGGDDHLRHKAGVPVLNSGEKVVFSQREWGAIMSQALKEDNSSGYAYMKWYMSSDIDNLNREIYFPLEGVSTEYITKEKLDFESLLNEEYYDSCPSCRK